MAANRLELVGVDKGDDVVLVHGVHQERGALPRQHAALLQDLQHGTNGIYINSVRQEWVIGEGKGGEMGNKDGVWDMIWMNKRMRVGGKRSGRRWRWTDGDEQGMEVDMGWRWARGWTRGWRWMDKMEMDTIRSLSLKSSIAIAEIAAIGGRKWR